MQGAADMAMNGLVYIFRDLRASLEQEILLTFYTNAVGHTCMDMGHVCRSVISAAGSTDSQYNNITQFTITRHCTGHNSHELTKTDLLTANIDAYRHRLSCPTWRSFPNLSKFKYITISDINRYFFDFHITNKLLFWFKCHWCLFLRVK